MIAKAYRSCSGRSSGCAVITSDAVRNLMHHVCYFQFPNGKVLLQVFGQYFIDRLTERLSVPCIDLDLHGPHLNAA
jgi:hypothetical protein